MSAHSPTPWIVSPDERDDIPYYGRPGKLEIVGWNINAADGAELVGCEGILGDGEHIANRIVHAVNLHDEMVEALKILRNELQEVLAFALEERSPLREPEIASIRAALSRSALSKSTPQQEGE